MAGHEKQDLRARQRAQVMLASLGRELRIARLNRDLSQTSVAQAIGMSTSAWSRMERGIADNLSLSDLIRALTAVGLDLSVRAYPGGQPVRDQVHVRLLSRFRSRLGAGATWQTEVPLPKPGDQRAWDALVVVPGARIGIEAETRVRESQELERRLSLKRRDGGADHVILLLSDTRHNRTFVRTSGEGLRAAFPLEGQIVLARLAATQDPGGSAIILI